MKLRIGTAVALALLVPALGQSASDVERRGQHGFVLAGSLEPGEVDLYAVRLRAGELLTLSLRDAEGGEFHDPLIGVFAPSQQVQPLALDDDGGPGFLPRLALRAPRSGVFTVAVTGFGDDDFDGSGHSERLGYRLVVGLESDPPQLVEREAGGRRPSADLLRLRRGAAVVSGRLAPGDSDVFELWLDADATLTASVFEPGGGAFHDPVLRLRDTRGQLLAENDDGGPGFLANLAFEAKQGGPGRRPIPVLLELTGFDPDDAGAAAHVEDFSYQLVISLDHFE
ncbi:MAG: hypothetical protein ACREI8_16010 [Myxococcota bacterium]